MSTTRERIVNVEVHQPYPVVIAESALATLGRRLAAQVKPRKAVLITDDVVGPLHANQAIASLQAAGFTTHQLTIPAGDASKSLTVLSRLYDGLADAGVDRSTPLVALGGGVVSDLTGFIAATWVRGVPFVNCPTTLEADVDASVGGKTGINHASGKNMIGAFYQPLMVLVDTHTLSTLSPRDFRAGLAESIKHAVIRDAGFFAWHEASADTVLDCDPEALGELVERNVRIKAAIVGQDEREINGLRALLNFGHTVGHAVESAMARRGDPWRHGEAIAVGMVAAAEMSVRAGTLPRDDAERIVALLERMNLPTSAPLARFRPELMKLMQSDKKAAAGHIRFVLAESLGNARLRDDINPEWIEAGLDRVVK